MKAFVRGLLPKPTRIRLSHAWLSLRALPGVLWTLVRDRPIAGRPAVFYGLGSVPGLRETTHGGLVKIQRMQEAFPNTPRGFNVIYLVSSAAPPGAVPLIRWARRLGRRFVWNQDGVAYPAWHGPGWEATNAHLAACLREADHVFYQSAFCKASADRFLGEKKGSWEILHNSVDTSVFRPAEADPAPGRLVLLLGGNQDQLYRFESAVRVLRRVVDAGVDARLIVTGRLRWDDPVATEREARELVSELKLHDRVELLGPYSQIEAPRLFQRAHVLIHTKHNDPCPGLVLEAMACGLPVVYSASGGVPELVGEEAGIGVPVEQGWEREIAPDPAEMERAVLKVQQRRSEYAAAARGRAVARFELRAWLERHREVFERVQRL